MTNLGWYLRILNLKNQTRILIIIDWDHFVSPKPWKIRYISLTSIRIKAIKYIWSSIFFFLKPSDLIHYLIKYNNLYHQLKWIEKRDKNLEKYWTQDTVDTNSNILSFELDFPLRIIFVNLLFLSPTHINLEKTFF